MWWISYKITGTMSPINSMLLVATIRYISVEEKKTNCKRKETEVLLQRRKPDPSGQMASVPYQVLDNPLRLTPSDWWVCTASCCDHVIHYRKRVVAVFVAGPSWQFKGWPWIVKGGSPADIFTKSRLVITMHLYTNHCS